MRRVHRDLGCADACSQHAVRMIVVICSSFLTQKVVEVATAFNHMADEEPKLRRPASAQACQSVTQHRWHIELCQIASDEAENNTV